MTIRELISCLASDTCTKFSIRTTNYWVRLFAAMNLPDDPDLIVLDALADMRINNWYINPSAEIVIYTDDEMNKDQIDLCQYYGFGLA